MVSGFGAGAGAGVTTFGFGGVSVAAETGEGFGAEGVVDGGAPKDNFKTCLVLVVDGAPPAPVEGVDVEEPPPDGADTGGGFGASGVGDGLNAFGSAGGLGGSGVLGITAGGL
jgi:hypothetical protein